MPFYRVLGTNYPMEQACFHNRSVPDKIPRPGTAILSRKVQNTDLSGEPTPRHTTPRGWALSKRRSRPGGSGDSSPTSNLGCYGSSGFVELPCHSVTIARTQVFTGFMTSEGMRRVA